MPSLDDVLYMIVPILEKKNVIDLMNTNKQINETVWEAKYGLIAKMVVEGRFYYDVFKIVRCKYVETLWVEDLKEFFQGRFEIPIEVETDKPNTKDIIHKLVDADTLFFEKLNNINVFWPNSNEEKRSSGCSSWFIGTMRVIPVQNGAYAMQMDRIEMINTILEDDDSYGGDSGYASPISPYTCSECGEEYGDRDLLQSDEEN